jgi:hypothetical protein
VPQEHINDEQLDLYAAGSIPAEDLPQVEEHLLLCESCRTRLSRADEFAALFRQAAALPGARARMRWLTSWRWRTAAGFAAAAVVTVMFVASRREQSAVLPAIVSMQSLRGPEAPARIEAGRAAILVFDIEAQRDGGYEARIVDPEGKEVLHPRTQLRDGHLAIAVERLSKGSYWVRVYRTGGRDAVAEYGLEAR